MLLLAPAVSLSEMRWSLFVSVDGLWCCVLLLVPAVGLSEMRWLQIVVSVSERGSLQWCCDPLVVSPSK